MPRIIGSRGTRIYKPVMIFIDGGYLRKGFEEIIGRKIGDQPKDFSVLQRNLMQYVSDGSIVGELRRVYYYDATVDPSDSPEKYKELDDYFENIRKCDFYTVKLGRMIRTNGDYRQKGVDVLITIDMLTKAFQNHYDIAVFVGGDDDFIDLVESVKELAGKRIQGFYFPRNTSKRLLNKFDSRIDLAYNLPKWFKK